MFYVCIGKASVYQARQIAPTVELPRQSNKNFLTDFLLFGKNGGIGAVEPLSNGAQLCNCPSSYSSNHE